jgi:hypothetical protein
VRCPSPCSRHPGLASIGQEGHALWETFHGPWDAGWESNALGAEDVSGRERRYLAWAIGALAKPRDEQRFVDKTPRNALRLPYLDALFPDATFVFVHRDGRAVVSSLLVAWRGRQTAAYTLPEPITIDGRPLDRWHFVLPPGWRDLDGRRLEDVCALQYVTCTEAIADFRDRLGPARAVDLRYEDLLADPVEQMRRVHDALRLGFGDVEEARARAEVRTPSGPEKWRTRTPDEIENVLPSIRPTLERTGYEAPH